MSTHSVLNISKYIYIYACLIHPQFVPLINLHVGQKTQKKVGWGQMTPLIFWTQKIVSGTPLVGCQICLAFDKDHENDLIFDVGPPTPEIR